jgi:two-component system, NtrC family, response regulator AtoC
MVENVHANGSGDTFRGATLTSHSATHPGSHQPSSHQTGGQQNVRRPLDVVRTGMGELLGDSEPMRALFDQIRRVAPTRASVLIIGESGVGKELLARTLHDHSPRADEPFLSVNCGAIAPGLIEAELFGHERGAFPGAMQAGVGYFERAGAGTLLLDEITELPLDMQVKLLRVLDTETMGRVGSDQETPVRCRVIAATNRDPDRAVADGKLRADLLYRLAVFPLPVPPLRERDDDVELLAHYFLASLNAEEGTSKRFSGDSLLCLRQYHWPGNVRELRNVVHRAFILATDDLELRGVVGRPVIPTSVGDELALRIPVGTNLADAERWMIIATLKKCGGNKTRAAALLGVSLKTLYNRLNAYRAAGLDMGDFDGELTEVAV